MIPYFPYGLGSRGLDIALSASSATGLLRTDNAVRFLAIQAQLCRDRDDHEALCLLLPALMRVLNLQPMDSFEAAAFRAEFKRALQEIQ